MATEEPSELQIQPNPLEPPETEPGPGPSLADALRADAKRQPWLKRLWHGLTGTPKRLTISIIVVLLLLAAIIGLTPLKYMLLGPFMKANIDVVVSDAVTGQVLPGATVNLAGATSTTDKLGTAHFTKLHPGATTLTITKAAYTTSALNLTLGFGDNSARNIKLTSKGIRLTFNFTNYVTGKPVAGAQVKVADADVVAGSSGQAVASVTPAGNDGQTEAATITLDGYNDLSVPVKITPGADPISAILVPAGSVYYLSNRSGKIDLYQANLDDTNANVILPGTGNEDGSTGILPNVYDPTVLALISSRAGVRVGGDVREDLYVFHTDTKQLVMVDTNIRYPNYRTWLGKTLIYQKFGSTDDTRTSIEAYIPASSKHATISACTSDGACPQALYATDDLFLFSLSGAAPGSSSNGLFAVKNGSTSGQSLSSTPAQSALRQVKNTILLEYYNYNYGTGSTNQWQSLDLTTTKVSSLAAGPASNTSRTYVDSPGDKVSVSVDKRDGQSDLYLTGEDGSNERQLTTTGNVSEFVQWYGDTYVVYSAANQLYVVGVAGGTPKKITNFYSGDVLGYGGGYNPSYQ